MLLVATPTRASLYGPSAGVAVDVHVHDERFGFGIVEDLRTFENPTAAEILGIAQFDDLIAEGPMGKIG